MLLLRKSQRMEQNVTNTTPTSPKRSAVMTLPTEGINSVDNSRAWKSLVATSAFERLVTVHICCNTTMRNSIKTAIATTTTVQRIPSLVVLIRSLGVAPEISNSQDNRLWPHLPATYSTLSEGKRTVASYDQRTTALTKHVQYHSLMQPTDREATAVESATVSVATTFGPPELDDGDGEDVDDLVDLPLFASMKKSNRNAAEIRGQHRPTK